MSEHDDPQGVLRHRLAEAQQEFLQMTEAWGAALRDRDEARDVACRLEERLWVFAHDVAIQFGYWTEGVGGLTTGGLSTLEATWDILGWEDPQPLPELRCDVDGCLGRYTCGWPSPDGYRKTCGDHWRSLDARLVRSDDDAAGASGVVQGSR